MNPNPAHLPSDPTVSRDPDNTIDRALSMLRDAQPRSDLNTRILASLEQRTAAERPTEPGGPSFHSFIVKGWGIVCGSKRENAGRTTTLPLWPTLAACACAVAVSGLAIFHHHSPSVERSKSTVILSEASRTGSPASLLAGADRDAQPKDPEDVGRRVPQVSILRPGMIESPRISVDPTPSTARHPERSIAQRRTAAFVSCANHQPTGCPIHAAPGSPASVPGSLRWQGVSGVATSADLDAQALADLHAPSHPAPPLPLTPQEKLFLRMTRYGNATQLAELNPAVRAQQEADETTAFKAFFPDPPPLKQPGDDE